MINVRSLVFATCVLLNSIGFAQKILWDLRVPYDSKAIEIRGGDLFQLSAQAWGSTSEYNRRIRVQKTLSNGTVARVDSSSYDSGDCFNIGVNNDGSYLVTGIYTGTLHFGNNISLRGPSDKKLFLVFYDSLGNAIWAKGENSIGIENSLTEILPNGAVLLYVECSRDSFQFDNSWIPGGGICLLLTQTGELLSYFPIGKIRFLDSDSESKLHVVAEDPNSSDYSYRIYDLTGTRLQERSLSGLTVSSLSVGFDGAYLAGGFYGNYQFDDFSTSGKGSFIAHLNSTAKFDWGRVLEPDENVRASFAFKPHGGVYVTGYKKISEYKGLFIYHYDTGGNRDIAFVDNKLTEPLFPILISVDSNSYYLVALQENYRAQHILRYALPNNVKEEKSTFPIQVYPNPAREELNIVFGTECSGTLTIHDQLGKSALTKNIFQTKRCAINTATLAKGQYIIVLPNGNRKMFTKE